MVLSVSLCAIYSRKSSRAITFPFVPRTRVNSISGIVRDFFLLLWLSTSIDYYLSDRSLKPSRSEQREKFFPKLLPRRLEQSYLIMLISIWPTLARSAPFKSSHWKRNFNSFIGLYGVLPRSHLMGHNEHFRQTHSAQRIGRAKGIAKCEASQSHGRPDKKDALNRKQSDEQFDETPTEMIETMRVSS